MEYREFFDRLKKNSLPQCILMHGEEEFIKRQALEMLRSAMLPDGLEAMNETVLDAQAGEQTIIEACETLPFMAEKRLVLVRDHPLVLTGKAGGDEGLVVKYLPNMPPFTMLVFYARANADSRKRLPQAIHKAGGMVVFGKMTDADLFALIRRECKSRGCDISRLAAERLVWLCGRDMTALSGEIEKACAYAGEGEIGPEDIEAVAIPSLESNVYRFADNIVSRDAHNALLMRARLLHAGESPIMILATMVRVFRQLHHAKLMLEAATPKPQIFESLGVGGFVAERILKQAAPLRADDLGEAVSLCVAADYDIKSGKMREENALDYVIMCLLANERGRSIADRDNGRGV